MEKNDYCESKIVDLFDEHYDHKMVVTFDDYCESKIVDLFDERCENNMITRVNSKYFIEKI